VQWTRQHNGSVTQMLREVMDRPVWHHVRSTCVMIILSTGFLIALILVPIVFAAVAGSPVRLLPVSSTDATTFASGSHLQSQNVWSVNASRLVDIPAFARADTKFSSSSAQTVTVNGLSAASSVFSILGSGAFARGSITVLSVQCMPLRNFSTAHLRAKSTDGALLQSFPPTCPPSHVLALRLYVSCRRSHARGLSLTDLFVPDSELETLNPFSVGGLMSSLPDRATNASSSPGAAVLSNSSTTALSSPDFSFMSFTWSRFVDGCHFILVGTANLAEWVVASFRDTVYWSLKFMASVTSLLRVRSTPTSSTFNTAAPREYDDGLFVNSDDPDIVYQDPDDSPSFNLTLVEGSYEFKMIAPAVWRALALQTLEAEMSHSYSESQAVIACGAQINSSLSEAALAMIPPGMFQTNFAVICNAGASADLPASDSTSAAVSVPPLAELFLRQMPVFRFTSLSSSDIMWEQLYTEYLDAEESLVRDSTAWRKRNKISELEAYCHMWRLRHVGAVTLITKNASSIGSRTDADSAPDDDAASDLVDSDSYNDTAGSSVGLSERSVITWATVSGSSFGSLRVYDLSYRLPPSIPPRVDDLTLWWSKPTVMVAALQSSSSAALNGRSSIAQIFDRTTLLHDAASLRVNASDGNRSVDDEVRSSLRFRIGQIVPSGPHAGMRVCKKLNVTAASFFSEASVDDGHTFDPINGMPYFSS
jgi:hypothetical protein